MAIVSELLRDADRFFQTKVTNLNNEVAFADSIQTEQGDLQSGIVSRLANDGLIATGGIGLNQKLELAGLVPSIAGAPFIADFAKNLLDETVSNIIDPIRNTGISGVLNTALGDFAKNFVPVDDLQFGIETSVSSIAETFVGDNNTVSELSKGLTDSTQLSFTRMIGSIGLTLITDPSSIFGVTDGVIDAISVTAGVNSQKLEEIISLEAEIINLLLSLTNDYYEVELFDKIRLSRNKLESADDVLINVRSQMISLGIFAESLFLTAKEQVNQAEQLLDFDITTDPRVLEINDRVDRLEQLLDEAAKEGNEVIESRTNLTNVIGDLLQSRAFGMVFAGQIQKIQLEIRSIIRSMDEARRVKRAAIASPLSTLWRTQLIMLSQVMDALPEEIKQYLTTDPDGFKVNFDVTINAMNLLGDPGIDALVSQGRAFVGAVRSALGNKAFLTTVSALGTAMNAEATSIKGFMDAIIVIGASHIKTPAAVQEFFNIFGRLLEKGGLDRAADLLKFGDINGLLTLDTLGGTYSGALQTKISTLIKCIEDEPSGTIDRTGLNALKEVQDFFANVRRGEALLASTFETFKDKAKENIRQIEMPALRRIKNKIDRIGDQLTGTKCDV